VVAPSDHAAGEPDPAALETIALFEKLVLDDRTYELKGERSIHRVLESAMWLVDERYWLMSSNRTLRTLIGRAIQRERRAELEVRPDFACAQLGLQGWSSSSSGPNIA